MLKLSRKTLNDCSPTQKVSRVLQQPAALEERARIGLFRTVSSLSKVLFKNKELAQLPARCNILTGRCFMRHLHPLSGIRIRGSPA